MSILTDWLVGDNAQTASEAQSNYDRQKAELQASIAARTGAGTISPEQAAFYEANTGALNSTDKAALIGAVEGAGEGLQTAAAGVNKTLAGTANLLFSAIPWQVWAIAIVALFIWAGGLQAIKGKLAKI